MAEEADAEPELTAEAATFQQYDDDYPPSLGFDEWLAISARLSAGDAAEQPAMLAEHSIEPVIWVSCDAYWLTVLAGDIAKRDYDRTARFAEACASAKELCAAQAAEPPGSPSLPLDEAGDDEDPDGEVQDEDLAPVTRALPARGDPQLSVEQYALLCARLSWWPERQEQICASFGLSSASVDDLHSSWRARLQADWVLQTRWHMLERQYREQLLTGKP